MKLTILERIMLLGLLPKEGNFLTLRMVRELREELSFSEQENKDFNLVLNTETGNVTWSVETGTNPEKDVSIGTKMKALIVELLTALDADNKLTEQHCSLYEKFVGE